jgi:dipeptidyl aminopeptidase/acylaminoacyl peptidase
MDRRAQPSLSLQLRPGQSGSATAKLERQLTKATSKWARCSAWTRGQSWSTTPRTRAIRWSSSYGRSEFDGERKQLSARRGVHEAELCARRRRRICRQAIHAHEPPTLRCARRRASAMSFGRRGAGAYHLRAPEQLEVKAHDGTTLYATLLLPEGATNPGQPCR